MATFDELIAGLSRDQHARGREFERVCRWYLEHDPVMKHQFRRVWLWRDWHGRWGRDAGIDLVAETHAGDLWAIQAKAYSPNGTVTKADIDTFLSESSRSIFAARLLISATDRISHNAHQTITGQEKPIRVLTASQLEHLDLNWPSAVDELRVESVRSPKLPRPHQREAIRDVLKGFDHEDRGQLVMACGTGKTLVGLWVWEKLEASKTLVVLPSISLLAQTHREWCANAQLPFIPLAVCSDESVTSDSMVSRTSQLPFLTTTNPDEIAAFITSVRDERCVIFSTYHSTPSLAQALAQSGDELDIIVADEAHRCAGRVDKRFSCVLDQSLIPAKRRLFMTATPRYLSPRLIRASSELDVETASMDQAEVFGKVFHRLTFGHAIAKDLLTDYQVVVIAVEDPRYRRMAELGSIVSAGDGHVTDAFTLATQAALLRGIAKYDLKRCVSFHSRVARAKRFADSLPTVAASLSDSERPAGTLWADHVSGAMQSHSRDLRLNRLRSLEACDRGLLANARCLSEGIDVPALDGVAFVDPRASQIDIIQAVGRVIRRAADKKNGTVLLPVIVGPEDDATLAIEDSAFERVWRVLAALRAHDDLLAEELDAMRIATGTAGGPPERPQKIRLDLPERIGSDFLEAFDAKLVERLTSRWHYWYGLALRFADEHKHLRVPSGRDEGRRDSLANWIEMQRYRHRLGVLSPDRVSALDALPYWTWDPYDDSWAAFIEALRMYLQREGHIAVPRGHQEAGRDLGNWISNRRADYRRGRLPVERIAELGAIPGWSWAPKSDGWTRSLDSLLAFSEREGHTAVPYTWKESGRSLGSWVAHQRMSRRRGTLAADRVRRLEAVPNWYWDGEEAAWVKGIDAIRRYVAREGHSIVPASYVDDGFAVGNWVTCRRADFRNGRLRPEQTRQLEVLPGWSWTPIPDRHAAYFEALRSYAQREGHSRVPAKHIEDGMTLGQWVRIKRRRYHQGKLSSDEIRLLEAVPGWSWSPDKDSWREHFQLLVQYATREGNAQVPYNHVESGRQLGNWLTFQRTLYRQGRLSSERAALLTDLPNWTWVSVREERWTRCYEALRCFSERAGHCTVPDGCEEGGVRLDSWIAAQRAAYRSAKLGSERVAALEALPGWTWRPHEQRWERGIAALTSFVEREGHSRVPASHTEEGFPLGQWVSARRQEYRLSRLKSERIAVLEAKPGWAWSASGLHTG